MKLETLFPLIEIPNILLNIAPGRLPTNIIEPESPNSCIVHFDYYFGNITSENIGEIMLSNIPGVSNKSATLIMNEFKTIRKLLAELEKNDTCLDNFKITCETGKTRRLSKTCVENIKLFLI